MELSGAIVKVGDPGAEVRAIVPENASELGLELLSESRKRRLAVKQGSLAACVEDFDRQKEVLRQRIREAQDRINQIEARQTDIAEGRFAVTEDAKIIFPHLPPPHIG